jgi:hypothetical protein
LREPQHFYEASAPGKHFCIAGNFPLKLQFCEARNAKRCITLVESELQHDVVLADRIYFKDFNKYYLLYRFDISPFIFTAISIIKNLVEKRASNRLGQKHFFDLSQK